MGKRGLEGFKIALDAMLCGLVFIGFLGRLFLVWFCGGVYWLWLCGGCGCKLVLVGRLV